MKDIQPFLFKNKLHEEVVNHLREMRDMFGARNTLEQKVKAISAGFRRQSEGFAAISTSLLQAPSEDLRSGDTESLAAPSADLIRQPVEYKAQGSDASTDAEPPASQCIAEGVELESSVMEEREDLESADEAIVGPLPRWETVDSVEHDWKWWAALPRPVPWLRKQKRLGGMTRSRKLKEELQRLVARQERKKKMHIGVVVEHLPSGERVSVNGSEVFPLASVAKVPILIAAAWQLQEAEADPRGVRLTTRLRLTDDVKCIGSGELHERPSGEGVTLGECLELSCCISDNTAADLVLQQVTLGRVQSLLRDRGLRSTDLYLSQRQAFLIAMGMTPSFRHLSAPQIAHRWERMSAGQRAAIISEAEHANSSLRVESFRGAEKLAEANYKRAGRNARRDSMAVAAAVDNTASPEDMAALLRDLASGAILAPKWTRHCMGILSRQQYGKRRLPRGLPKDTRVYHKTGTIMGVCNDVGIIEVGGPENLVVVAALVAGIAKSQYDREAEAVIAQIARLAYKAYKPSTIREGHVGQRQARNIAPDAQKR